MCVMRASSAGISTLELDADAEATCICARDHARAGLKRLHRPLLRAAAARDRTSERARGGKFDRQGDRVLMTTRLGAPGGAGRVGSVRPHPDRNTKYAIQSTVG